MKRQIFLSHNKLHTLNINLCTAKFFSFTANHLACGTINGTIWFLHPTTLEPLSDKPFKQDSGIILGIRFSEMGDYCAFFVTIFLKLILFYLDTLIDQIF